MARAVALQSRSTPAIQRAKPVPVAAPVGGWNTRDNISAMKPTDALALDNWIVRPGQVTMRKGQTAHQTGYGEVVETLMPWVGGSASKLFAATSTGIYDGTAAGSSPGSVSSAATNGQWQFTNYSNSTGERLVCVNGVDSYRYYDGSAWTTFATFAYGSGTINTSTLTNVTGYNQRLFFCVAGSPDLWFLGIGAVSGTIFNFPLGQLFRRGGYLAAICTWTIDTAGNGPNDLLVAVSSEGEVIVYQGIDPTVAAEWTLQGVYYIGAPIGKRCLQKFGGDLLYLSIRGLVPMSKALQSTNLDRTVALSDKINNSYNVAAATVGSLFGWEIMQHDTESFLLINIPSTPPQQFVMDFQSKSWSRFLGFNASCWAYFEGQSYYGTQGQIVQAYTGMSDFGGNIAAICQTAYNYFGNFSGQKKLGLVRPSFSATGQFNYSLSASTDFDVFGGSSVLQFGASEQSRWDASYWDSAVWTSDYYLQNKWNSVSCWPFFAMSLGIKVATMGVLPSLIAVDYTFEGGGIL